jgi:hypothetical protein
MSKAKTYIITDPCYILPDDIYHECFEKYYRENKSINDPENYKAYCNDIAEALRKYSNTEYKVYVSSTGFGDWTNVIFGPNVLQADFAADSGLVCVCELTDVINEHLERTDLFVPCYGVFATEGEVSVEFDRTVPDWVVVKITDEDGNCWETLPAEEDDEE